MVTETVFECPKCGKQGVVRLHSDEDVFECIYCRHKNDLSKDEASDNMASWLTVLMLVIFTVLIVVGL